jgi:peptidoglycan/LPS O-acetylase OafA/YrhL
MDLTDRQCRLFEDGLGNSLMTKHYVLLDGLRGLAAIAVLVRHLFEFANLNRPPQSGLAVDFFFILSGFVVAHAYRDRLLSGMGFRRFAQVRFIRLYPLLMLGAIFGVALTFLGTLTAYAIEPWRFWCTAGLAVLGLPSMLVPNWPTAFPINPPAWSLFFELAVNFIYAPLAKMLTKRVLWVLTFVSGAVLILVFWQRQDYDIGFDKSDLWSGASRVAFGFSCGLLLNALTPVRAMANWGGLLIAIGVCTLLLWPTDLTLGVHAACVIFVFPLIVYVAAPIAVPRRMSAICMWLGSISYPLYILHAPTLRVLDEVAKLVDPQQEYLPLILALQALICIGVAWMALKLFDEPVRRWLGGRHRREPTPAPS